MNWAEFEYCLIPIDNCLFPFMLDVNKFNKLDTVGQFSYELIPSRILMIFPGFPGTFLLTKLILSDVAHVDQGWGYYLSWEG